MALTLVGPLSSLSPGLAGGISAAYDIAAAAVIKSSQGVCVRASCQTAGTLTLNDAATTGAAAITNQFFTLAMTAGQVVELDWPCASGIVASGASGVFAVAFT